MLESVKSEIPKKNGVTGEDTAYTAFAGEFHGPSGRHGEPLDVFEIIKALFEPDAALGFTRILGEIGTQVDWFRLNVGVHGHDVAKGLRVEVELDRYIACPLSR